MTHEEIEEYLKDKDLNAKQYQLVMDAMLFAEQKMIDKACKWLNDELYENMVEPNPYYIYEVQSKSYNSVEIFINEFKKSLKS